MTASGESGPPPFLVLEIGCDCCAGVFVATGELATTLRGLPAVWALTSGTRRPTRAERDELAATASRPAKAAGWVPRPDRTWRCPRCAEKYTDRDPRHYTVADVHRIHAGLRAAR